MTAWSRGECVFEVDAPVWGSWAKAWSTTGPHPLVCHAIDTAAVAELLYDVLLGPETRRDVELGLGSLGDVRSWVAVLCGLHDIGKCSPIFQSMRPDVAQRYLGVQVRELLHRLYSGSRDRDVRTPHGTLTAVHMARCLSEWGAGPDLRDAVAYGLGGHHGYLMSAHAVQYARRQPLHHGKQSWHELRCKVVREIARLWNLGDPAEAAWNTASLGVPGMVGLAGLASVSDWIASDTKNFSYAVPPVSDLEAYWHVARALAKTAITERLRWKRWSPPADTSYRALFAQQPVPLQAEVEHLVADRDEPGVLVIEAPTGEGKTRAGLQAAATLARRLGLSGMYFALPTRATAAQVQAELAGFADALGFDEPPNLVHAGASVAPSSVDEDGDGAHDGHEWFTRKRGLLFPVGVGTIDQALQAVIRSRHVFVRLAGLSGKVLVLDEVHDVDAHMSTLLRRLMWWCGRFGIPVVLMSATLPANDREQLIAHWRGGRRQVLPGQVSPRPITAGGQRITWIGDEEELPARPIGLSSTNAQRPAVVVHHIGDDDLAYWLRQRVSSRGCALIIRNLVRDAERSYARLADEITTWSHKPELVLLTGHVPGAEKVRIEERLRPDFGRDSAVRPHAIVIGTQVLQHSLDLDFDLLASDLAPINELIQRLGRVHRHDRDVQDRACQVPELGLLQPPEGKTGPVFGRGLHTVYHHALLLRTWSVLWGRTELKLPAETPDLVHAVYTKPERTQGAQRQRFEKADETMARRDSEDESQVRLFYLPALRAEDSIRDLTKHPTVAARTRKGTPWKDRM